MKITLSKRDLEKVRMAAEIIESDIKQHVRVDELAEKVYLNVHKLKTGFKQQFGVGPYRYLQQKRIALAKQMLLNGDNVSRIALSVGFVGEYAKANFIKSFKKCEKMSPNRWRLLYCNQNPAIKEKIRLDYA